MTEGRPHRRDSSERRHRGGSVRCHGRVVGRVRLLLGLMLGASSAVCGSDSGEQAARDAVIATHGAAIKPLLATYCCECHDSERHKGDIDLTPLTARGGGLDQTELWRAVGAKIASNEMPPAKAKQQPSSAERQALLAWLKARRRLQPADPGVAVSRRLARSEYANTMRDLFGAPIEVGADLPPDNPGEGFDNSLSPLLGEKYLLAADAVLDRFIVADQMNQHSPAGQLAAVVAGKNDPGKPDGAERVFTTPGEIVTELTIPSEGTYTIRVQAGAEPGGAEPVRLAIRIDGKVVTEVRVVATLKTKAAYTCTTRLSPGRVALSVLYANPLAPTDGAPAPAKQPSTPAPGSTRKDASPGGPPAKPRCVAIEAIDIVGPPAKMAGEVQRRLFVAVPGKGVARRDAAQRILEPFALRAFRRPPQPDEVALLMAIFDLGESQDLVFSESIKLALKAVLISPQFLYRTPDDDGREARDGIVALGDYELASRLSYFLWATMPDDELLRAAHDRTLHQPEVLAAQTKRLLADPRARALADGFAAPWLGLDKLAELAVDEKKFPLMTREMRQAMYDEGIAFFLGLLQGGGSLTEMIDGDYAFMNGLTARIYGNDEVKGPKMQKVHLADRNRGGVVTMPGVLAVTSMATRTSPVKRGKWILEQLLDAAPPPPPANVPDLAKQDTVENAKLTLRQRTERHRSDPACAACHRVMDPLGFGLENFDAIGRWREVDDYGAPVDALGELPGRQSFASPAALRALLLARKDQFVRAFAGKLLAFALGRRLAGYDEVVLDDLVDAVAAHGYRLDDLVARIVASYPFLNRHALHRSEPSP